MYAQSRQFHHMDRQSQHNLLELHIESGSTCQDMVFFLTVVIVKMTLIQNIQKTHTPRYCFKNVLIKGLVQYQQLKIKITYIFYQYLLIKYII